MKTRTLTFPPEPMLGYLHTRQEEYPYSFHGRYKKEGGLLDGVENAGWTLHGAARSEQRVDGDVVMLEVLAEPARDLSPLTALQPNAIEALWLGNTWVDDNQLHHLRHLTGLRWLNIENNHAVTDAGLAQLAGLTALVHIGIHWTNVTDAGLRHLHGMTSLQFLDVWGCKVTENAFSELKARFPNCSVRS